MGNELFRKIMTFQCPHLRVYTGHSGHQIIQIGKTTESRAMLNKFKAEAHCFYLYHLRLICLSVLLKVNSRCKSTEGRFLKDLFSLFEISTTLYNFVKSYLGFHEFIVVSKFRVSS